MIIIFNMIELPNLKERYQNNYTFFLTEGAKKTDMFFENPLNFVETLTKKELTNVIYKSDRSIIYRVSQNPFSEEINNKEPIIIKQMVPNTKEIVKQGRQQEAQGLLRRRIANNIYSPRIYSELEINTDAQNFICGLVDSSIAFLAYKQFDKGVFFDDYLANMDKFSKDIPLEKVLDCIAKSVLKLHGKRGEKGILHNDLNTGNIFLSTENKTNSLKNNGLEISIIDWELCDYNKGKYVIEDSKRYQELFTLAGENRNLYSAARLKKEDFLILKKIYNNYLNK